MISDSRDEGLIDDEEHQRLTRALASVGRTVADVMIPADVRCLDAAPGHDGPTLIAVEEAVAQTGYSRFPLRSANGALTGYLHLRTCWGHRRRHTRARHHHRRRSDLAPAGITPRPCSTMR